MIYIRTKELNFHFDNVYNEYPVKFGLFNLVQIGDISCKSGYSGPLHRQMCLEISYIVSGRGEFFIDNVVYPIKKGDIIINNVEEMHSTKSSLHDPLRFFYLGFNFNQDSGKYKEYECVINMFSNKESPVFSDHFNIYNIFINSFNEFINKNALKSEIIESCIQQIICYTYRNYFHEYGKYYSQNHNNISEDILYDIINYIDVNITKIKKLTDISKELNYSYSYISLMFSNCTGMTLKQYISNKKIEYAMELLKTDTSITEISERLGFESIHTFSRIFKKKLCVSPSVYRMEYQDQKMSQ